MKVLTAKLLLLSSILLLMFIGAAAAMWSTTLGLGVRVKVGYKDPVVEGVCHKVVSCVCIHLCSSECNEHRLNRTCSAEFYVGPDRRSVVVEGTMGNCSQIVMSLVMKVANRGTIPVKIVGFNTIYRPSSMSLLKKVFVVPKPHVSVKHPCQVLSKNLFRFTMDEPVVLYPGEKTYFIVIYILESSPGTRFSITTKLMFR